MMLGIKEIAIIAGIALAIYLVKSWRAAARRKERRSARRTKKVA